jgi:hypothetical protein
LRVEGLGFGVRGMWRDLFVVVVKMAHEKGTDFGEDGVDVERQGVAHDQRYHSRYLKQSIAQQKIAPQDDSTREDKKMAAQERRELHQLSTHSLSCITSLSSCSSVIRIHTSVDTSRTLKP